MEKKKFRLVKLKRYFTSKVLTSIIATGKHTRFSRVVGWGSIHKEIRGGIEGDRWGSNGCSSVESSVETIPFFYWGLNSSIMSVLFFFFLISLLQNNLHFIFLAEQYIQKGWGGRGCCFLMGNSFPLEGIKRKPLKYMQSTEQAQKRGDRKFGVLFCLKRCNTAIIQILSRKHLLSHSILCLAWPIQRCSKCQGMLSAGT